MKILILSRLLLILLVLVGVQSCKDSDASHQEAKLESCRLLVDEKQWDAAIAACEGVKNDEGWHLTAQSYMGRSGLSLFSLMADLTGDSVTPANLLFNYVPTTPAEAADYKQALDHIMLDVTEKTQIMYLEVMLVSSMLIFKELKDLLTLNVVNGSFTTCAGDPADITNCSFAPTLVAGVPPELSFVGLGTNFYDGLCGNSSSDVSAVGYQDSNPIEFKTVTINKCTIQNDSVLYYNKLANDNYKGSGISGLSILNFYNSMDSGTNFSITLSGLSVSFCNADGILPPNATPDMQLNDCEVLGYLLNPGF